MEHTTANADDADSARGHSSAENAARAEVDDDDGDAGEAAASGCGFGMRPAGTVGMDRDVGDGGDGGDIGDTADDARDADSSAAPFSPFGVLVGGGAGPSAAESEASRSPSLACVGGAQQTDGAGGGGGVGKARTALRKMGTTIRTSLRTKTTRTAARATAPAAF